MQCVSFVVLSERSLKMSRSDVRAKLIFGFGGLNSANFLTSGLYIALRALCAFELPLNELWLLQPEKLQDADGIVVQFLSKIGI